MSTDEHRQTAAVASGLGWFSIGLGSAQVVAPGAVARLVGLRSTGGTRWAMRAMGVREVASGVGILTSREPGGWLWGRVLGDGLDAVVLLSALGSAARPGRTVAALGAVAGAGMLDTVAALGRTGTTVADGEGDSSGEAQAGPGRPRLTDLRSVVTVNAGPHEAYDRWRDVERLPEFMGHLESVSALGQQRSHWVARGPAGMTVEWDAEIVDDIPGERIVWRSVEGASLENRGSVRFRRAPGGRGTEVTVEVSYAPPGGPIGAAIAKLFGEEPAQQVSDDLRRFKQLVETGEIARSDASPGGTFTKNLMRQRMAAPPDHIDLRSSELEGARP